MPEHGGSVWGIPSSTISVRRFSFRARSAFLALVRINVAPGSRAMWASSASVARALTGTAIAADRNAATRYSTRLPIWISTRSPCSTFLPDAPPSDQMYPITAADVRRFKGSGTAP